MFFKDYDGNYHALNKFKIKYISQKKKIKKDKFAKIEIVFDDNSVLNIKLKFCEVHELMAIFDADY